MFELAPSLLSADFTRLAEAISDVKAGGATVLHVDVMDGHFVPNITIGLPVVRSLRAATDMIIDTHLMITDPGRYAEQFVKAGANMVSVHVEADPHLQRTLVGIREAGGSAGIAINPGTPIELIYEVLPYADFVLMMSVNPGFSGQSFIPTMTDKLRRLKRMITSLGLAARIEIDGGIGAENIRDIVIAGADIVVAGSAVFGGGDARYATANLIEMGSETV